MTSTASPYIPRTLHNASASLRAAPSACKRSVLDPTLSMTNPDKQHMWIDCENNGQSQAWETAKYIWRKATDRQWPAITTGMVRGANALSFKDDLTKDSERLRILISVTIWSIWKSRNENSINNRDVTPNKTTGTLRELIRELIRKSWNSIRFMEGGIRLRRQRAIKVLWAEGRLTNFDPKTGSLVDLT